MLLALAGVAIGVVVGVLVPNVAGIFEGSGRPLPTMLGLAMALNARWPEIALLVAAAGVAAACATWWTTRPARKARGVSSNARCCGFADSSVPSFSIRKPPALRASWARY